MPLRRNTAVKASAPATDHTSVCSRATGTPSRAARSALSALARMAVPAALRRRKAVTATRTIGVTTSPSRSLASKVIAPIWRVASNGGAMRPATRSRSQSRGSSMATATSTWLRPMVATVTSRRGECEKRRITTRSVVAPRRTAAARPTTTATGYGTSDWSMSRNARIVGASPRSAWAKLMMWLAR